jgi:hypothetical protein
MPKERQVNIPTPPIDSRAGYLVIINDEHINYHPDLADLMGSWTPAACFDWHYGENSDALRATVCAMHGVDDLDALYDYANDEGDDEARSMFWALHGAGHTSEPIALRSDSEGAIVGAMAIANQWVDDSIADIDSCLVLPPLNTETAATLSETAKARTFELRLIFTAKVREKANAITEEDYAKASTETAAFLAVLQDVRDLLCDTGIERQTVVERKQKEFAK